MAVQHDPDRTFLHGLSDFWITYFQDTKFTETLFAGAQVMLGQVYLDLLQEVLGTSLDHTPLFSKKYYTLFQVREDQLLFVEGASGSLDRFAFFPPDAIVEAPTLINKVIAPTSYLFANADYEVLGGSLRFRQNPFNVNGGTQPGFAVRTTQAPAPVSQGSLIGTDWAARGVQPGDTFQFIVQSAPAIETTVKLIRGTRLVLSDDLSEFRSDLRGRSTKFRVLRDPFNGKQSGVRLPGTPLASEALTGATLSAGTKAIFSASAAVDWVGLYAYVDDAGLPTNSGLYRVNSVSAGTSFTLDRPTNFAASAGPVTVTMVQFGSEAGNAVPTVLLPHTYLSPGTFSVTGRRALAREVNGVLYAEQGPLIEGIDYAINYDEGMLTFLSVWDSRVESHMSYRWQIFVAEEEYRLRGAGDWDSSVHYIRGDLAYYRDAYWVSTGTATVGTFRLTEWVPYAPFIFDADVDVREIAFWAADVLVDEQRLYFNFGYLLGHQRASSEQYRAFLKGVAQLFLLGPSLARMRSALNVVAGLPVIREDGEVFQAVITGYHELAHSGGLSLLTGDPTLGDGGAVFDYAEGLDGTIDPTTGFSSPTAGFFAGVDVGTTLRVRDGSTVTDYVVTAIATNGRSATLSPPPVAHRYPVRWAYQHNAANGQFRLESTAVDYSFSEDDVDSVLTIDEVQGANWIASASYAVGAVVQESGGAYQCVTANSDASFDPLKWERLSVLPARNVGTFRVVGVDGPRTLRLDAPFGLTDARGLRWRLSRTQTQVVMTDKREYTLPLGVPLRDEIAHPPAGGLTFRAYDTLSSVIGVVDYIVDPTWWHRVKIPQDVLQLQQDAPGRRQVSPELIPNIIGPTDQAVIGDPGVFIGADDEGNPGYDRAGTAVWLGGPWVELTFDANVLRASLSDVGQSLTFEAGPFKGSYAVIALGPGDSLKLDRFPPPESRRLVPPMVVERVRLPSLVYRRTVAFVMMDRFLKYHAIHAEVLVSAGLPLGFLGDAGSLLSAAKPGYSYVFFEAATSFHDTFRFTETFLPDIGHPWLDRIRNADTQLRVDGSVRMGEFYRYFNGHVSGTSTGGALDFTVTPTLPYTPDRVLYVFGKFTQGTKDGHLLRLGEEYSFNYATGVGKVQDMDAGPYRFDYVLVALRVHSPISSPWWADAYPGETPIMIGGANPTVLRLPGTSERDEGVLERAIEITIASA